MVWSRGGVSGECFQRLGFGVAPLGVENVGVGKDTDFVPFRTEWSGLFVRRELRFLGERGDVQFNFLIG